MMKCLAVDDEALALDLLEDNIRQTPFLELVEKCKNTFEANRVLMTQKVDLLFLDIEMPGVSGIEFLKSIKAPPMVIFITGHKKFALEGFNLDAVDYLLKPVSFERFLRAVNKAYERYIRKQTFAPTQSKYIFVTASYSLVKINFDDILYVEGSKDYVKIYLSSASRPVVAHMSMKTLEDKLPSSRFSRVHRSFIISLDKVVSIRRGQVAISSVHIPISDFYRDSLYKLVDPDILV